MVERYSEDFGSGSQIDMSNNIGASLDRDNGQRSLPPRTKARNRAAEISRFMDDLRRSANMDGGSLLSQLRPAERREVEDAIRRMDAIDEAILPGRPIPHTVLEDYEYMIRANERYRSETRAHRYIAAFGRMRLIEHLYSAGNAAAVTSAMLVAMDKYPNLTREKNFVAMAAQMDFSHNPDFMRRFREYGGDESRLQLWTKTR